MLRKNRNLSLLAAVLIALIPKWVFTTGVDVSATPTVAGDAVYFPDVEGNLFAVKKQTGDLIWSHKISDYLAPWEPYRALVLPWASQPHR